MAGVDQSLPASNGILKKKSFFHTPAVPLFLVSLLWLFFLCYVPTYDLDESLYRRVAEEMKLHLFGATAWHPTWDGDALYHKPPLFYWLIIAVSSLIDGVYAPVSAFAARLPGVFSGIAILVFLKRISRDLKLKHEWNASFYFLCALFPVFTTPSVIYDALQTACLMPALWYSTRYFITETRGIRPREWLYWGVSIFFATAVKGLNGIIIPSFAFALHALYLAMRGREFKTFCKSGIIYTARVFLPAALASFFYYAWLDHEMGRDFTHEFFWVQHFGRSASAMEAHGGSVLYHPISIFFGAGILSALIYTHWKVGRPNYGRLGFPFTYALSFAFVFSFSATKLPHYTWPVWPALALAVALFSEGHSNVILKPWERIIYLPVLLFTLLSFVLMAITARWLNPSLFGDRTLLILPLLSQITILQRLCFGTAGIFGTLLLFRKWSTGASAAVVASLSLAFSLFFAFGALSTVNTFWVAPFYAIARDLKELHPLASDCIRYTGPHSPTFSLALGQELRHNRCLPNDGKYMIVPDWKLHECAERNFRTVAKQGYLTLCVRPE